MADRPNIAVLPESSDSATGPRSDLPGKAGRGSATAREPVLRIPQPRANVADGSQSVAEKVRAVVSAWADDHREDGSSWVASLVLHLAILLMLWQILLPSRAA